MRYEIPTIRNFWYLAHLLFQGRLQRFMTGYKNTGQVTSGETARGYYSPSESKINFAVPSDTTSLVEIKPPDIKGPGKFLEMIKLLDKDNCSFVLTFDRKKTCPWFDK